MTTSTGPLRSGLAAVLETALDAVVVMRFDGTVAAWNKKAEQTFGWTWQEAEGRRMSELIIPPRFRHLHEEGLSRFHATGEGPVLDRHIEITALNRAGRELPVELSITMADQFGDPVFIGFIRDITERHEAELRQQRMLRELSHRVKNMLAVVAAIAQQTARTSQDMDQFQEAYLGRLQSLARAHDLLVGAQWEDTSLGALVEAVSHAGAAEERVQHEGPELLLSPSQLLGLSMILHELFTNAMKYGALATPDGRVSLRWAVADDGRAAEILWKETGLTGVQPPKRSGFGHKMIGMSVRHDLRGQHESEWLLEGLTVRIRFPLSEQETAPHDQL